MKKILSVFAIILAAAMLLTSCSSDKKSGETEYTALHNLGVNFEYPADWEYSYTEGQTNMSVSEKDAKDFADNLYIIVDAEDEMLESRTESSFNNVYSISFKQFKMDSFKTYTHFLGENDDTYAIEINASHVNSENQTVYVRQYILNKNGKNYVMTFSTLRRQFPSSFQHIVDTLDFYQM